MPDFLLTIPRRCFICGSFSLICVLCLSVILSSLFLAALSSPAWKGLALLYAMFSCIFVTFPYGGPGQVWYLIVSIPGLYLFPYFAKSHHLNYLINLFKISQGNLLIIILYQLITIEVPNLIFFEIS